jgi:RNA polymerase sigma-70 factor (ECF subfamily)
MSSREDRVAEDEELLRAAYRRDEDAFRKLVEKHKDKVFRICLGFVRNPEEAEDLTQDVFFQVYKNAGRFRGQSAVSTWIYRITVNHSINRLRKRRAREWLRFLGGTESLDRRPSSGASPEVLLERRETLELIRKALDGLPANQRIAFTLHKVQAISYEEIAGIMDCSVSAVEARIHRAKSNLKKRLVTLIEKRK